MRVPSGDGVQGKGLALHPLYDTLLTHGDFYMHLADLNSYFQAHEQTELLYTDQAGWEGHPECGRSGKFSSDRTVADYAEDIWHLEPCAVA